MGATKTAKKASKHAEDEYMKEPAKRKRDEVETKKQIVKAGKSCKQSKKQDEEDAAAAAKKKKSKVPDSDSSDSSCRSNSSHRGGWTYARPRKHR